MIINVIAKSKSKTNRVVPVSDSRDNGESFIVYTKESPIDNRANIDIISFDIIFTQMRYFCKRFLGFTKLFSRSV